jgi:ribonuclease VapC
VIVVDTSAFMALLMDEPAADAIMAAIEGADIVGVSAATLAETLIVARRRNLTEEIAEMLAGLDFEVVEVSDGFAMRVADAYDKWGKGVHPAGLNIMDCFAYTLAMERGCPLLFVGDDFSKTDVAVALTS